MAHRFSSRRWSEPAPQAASHTERRPAQKPVAKPVNAPSICPTDFGCLLIPQFPVWAARLNDPALAAMPLLIHRKGRLLAASADALAMGVRVGWTLQRAHSLCPHAPVRAYNPGEEAHAWDEVLAALYRLTPRIESARPGLLFFEPPSPNSASWIATMGALAGLMKSWGAQAALASDRATSELGAHRVSPGTVRQVKNARGFLQRTPSAMLMELGLSAVASERLQWFGLKSVADLTRLSREQINCQFADPARRKDAALLWRFARAGTPDADRQPVQSYQLPPSRVSRFVFEQAATCPAEWESALNDAVQQVTAQLNGLNAGALSLLMETNAAPRSATKILREPVFNARALYRVAHELAIGLVQKRQDENSSTETQSGTEVQTIEVQAIEVRLSRLSADNNQAALFDTRLYDSSPQRHSPPTLLSALRNIESRYGGTMWKWKLRDRYAPLPEERFSLTPALDEYS